MKAVDALHAMGVGGDPVATQGLRGRVPCLNGIEIYVQIQNVGWLRGEDLNL